MMRTGKSIHIAFSVLFASVLSSAALRASDAPSTGWVCDRQPVLITNVRLPGSFEPTNILIVEGKFSWIGEAGKAPSVENAREIDGSGATALPGLIDSHTHFDSLPAAKSLQGELDVLTEIFPMTMRQTLASGVTTARAHLSSLDDMAVMNDLSPDNCFPSPRIYISGPGLLGGAPDVDARLMRGVRGAGDASDKMRELAELGATWAALHRIEAFSKDEAIAIRDAADRHNLKLMADTDSFASLEAALRLGVVSGEYINRTTADRYPENLLQMLKAVGADFYISPPLGYYSRSYAYNKSDSASLNDELFLFMPERIEKEMRQSFDDAFHRDEYISGAIAAFPTFAPKLEQLRSTGVQLVIGSDNGSLGQFHHDAVWQEMAAWHAFGISPADVLDGATRVPAGMLGASDIGVIKPGAQGDLVLYTGDLTNGEFSRSLVTTVIKGGVVYVDQGTWVGPDADSMVRRINSSVEAVE